MKLKNIFILVVLVLCFADGYSQSMVDSLSQVYCREISSADSVTRESFEDILPDIDHKIYFQEPEFVKTIASEIKERDISYVEFYTEVYNNFSKNCPAYQALYTEVDNTELKDPSFFLDSWCDCFNEHTDGSISGDLSGVIEKCNEEFANQRAYRKKVKKELKNNQLSEDAFSRKITADFLTKCDLIVNHMFSVRAKELAKNSQLLQIHYEMMENR